MGQSSANVEPKNVHGEDVAGPTIPWDIRLHLGDDDVDETWEMTEAIRANLMKQKWKHNDKPQFLTDFESWVNSIASTDAKAIKAKLARAAYRCF